MIVNVSKKEWLVRRHEEVERVTWIPPEEKESDRLLWRREAVMDYVNKIEMLQKIVK